MKSLKRTLRQHFSFQTIPNFDTRIVGRRGFGQSLKVAIKTCLVTLVAVSNIGYIPLFLGDLGNAQATLLEDLHVL